MCRFLIGTQAAENRLLSLRSKYRVSLKLLVRFIQEREFICKTTNVEINTFAFNLLTEDIYEVWKKENYNFTGTLFNDKLSSVTLLSILANKCNLIIYFYL